MAVNTARFRPRRNRRGFSIWFVLIVALILLETVLLLYIGFFRAVMNDRMEESGSSPFQTIESSLENAWISLLFSKTSRKQKDDDALQRQQIQEELKQQHDDEEDAGDDDIVELENLMVKQELQNGKEEEETETEEDKQDNQDEEEQENSDEEEATEQQQQEQADYANEDAAPLDNYYTRKSFYKSQQKSLSKQPKLLPLVVGGSDGSGTRSFVDVLAKLGIPMLVDDVGTMDIHATKAFDGQGWPPFALHALQYGFWSFSADNDNDDNDIKNDYFKDFPTHIKARIGFEMDKLRLHLMKRQDNLRRKALNITSTSPHYSDNHHILSPKTLFGFKAPITMLLLPIMAQFLFPDTGFRYLHVVRDGRDVALSSNQSPVQKFYNATYSSSSSSKKKNANKLEYYKAKNMTPVLGMQLWNDWNVWVHEYLTTNYHKSQKKSHHHDHATGTSSTNTNNIEYLIMRTEDLLHPTSKFEALRELSDFVGSTKSLHELCCQSRQAIVDMGQSGGIGGSAAARRRKRLHGGHFFQNRLHDFHGDGVDVFASHKAALLQELKERTGKTKFQELTPQERLAFIRDYRRRHGDDEGGNNQQDSDGNGQDSSQHDSLPLSNNNIIREDMFRKVGNRVAKRLGAKHSLQEEKNNAAYQQDKEERRAMFIEKLRTLKRQRGTGTKLYDNGILLGRRRRLLSIFPPRQDSDKRGIRHQYQLLQFHHDEEEGKEEGGPKSYNDLLKDRQHRRDAMLLRRRPGGSGWQGDVELGKLLSSQLEQFKTIAANYSAASKQSSNQQEPKKPANIVVKERYGKWNSIFKSIPALSDAMHQEGAEALKLFGYEPPRRFMDRMPPPWKEGKGQQQKQDDESDDEDDFVCDDAVVCPD